MTTTKMAAALVVAVLMGGCGTYTNLQTPEADHIRRMVAQHCDVGQIRIGTPSTITHVRVAKGAALKNMRSISAAHPISPQEVTIYTIEELDEHWLKADASTGRVRDNVYVNRVSGETVCSFDDWHGQLQLKVPTLGGASGINGVGGN